MCGRFTQNYTWAELHALMNLLGDARNLRPRYNIAPTTDVDVIRRNHDGERELSSMHGSLVSSF